MSRCEPSDRVPKSLPGRSALRHSIRASRLACSGSSLGYRWLTCHSKDSILALKFFKTLSPFRRHLTGKHLRPGFVHCREKAFQTFHSQMDAWRSRWRVSASCRASAQVKPQCSHCAFVSADSSNRLIRSRLGVLMVAVSFALKVVRGDSIALLDPPALPCRWSCRAIPPVPGGRRLLLVPPAF